MCQCPITRGWALMRIPPFAMYQKLYAALFWAQVEILELRALASITCPVQQKRRIYRFTVVAIWLAGVWMSWGIWRTYQGLLNRENSWCLTEHQHMPTTWVMDLIAWLLQLLVCWRLSMLEPSKSTQFLFHLPRQPGAAHSTHGQPAILIPLHMCTHAYQKEAP